MAYAGICSANNLQSNSDDHFHVASLIEISGFLSSSDARCAVVTNTGNTPPDVDAGPAGNPAYTIPINTPFALSGSATDANNDTLSYAWEEFDLGPAGAPASPSGNAPLFRSFSPTTSATRTFPKLADLLNDTSTIGELLPAYERKLTFQLTVRDNRAGGGATNADIINLKVSAGAGPFAVTAPDSAVSWPGRSEQSVSWNVANTSSSPVSCNAVDILLSTDGGNSFPRKLASATANDGNENISVPNLPTSIARVKVACATNVFFDISDSDFTITADPNSIFEDQFETAGLSGVR
jgi:hypothetical protein